MPCAEAVLFLEASSTTAEGFDDLSAKIWVDHPGCRFNAQWRVDTYRYHIPDISLRPGALDLLEGLKRRGVPIGIITDGRSATQRAKIKALGLDRFVADCNIIISGETGADKTTSLPFETLANRNPAAFYIWVIILPKISVGLTRWGGIRWKLSTARAFTYIRKT